MLNVLVDARQYHYIMQFALLFFNFWWAFDESSACSWLIHSYAEHWHDFIMPYDLAHFPIEIYANEISFRLPLFFDFGREKKVEEEEEKKECSNVVRQSEIVLFTNF